MYNSEREQLFNLTDKKREKALGSSCNTKFYLLENFAIFCNFFLINLEALTHYAFFDKKYVETEESLSTFLTISFQSQ